MVLLQQLPLDFPLRRKIFPCVFNLSGRVVCYLKTNAFLTGTVLSRDVGRKAFSSYQLHHFSSFLIWEHTAPDHSHSPKLSWINLDMSCCSFHINSRILSPKYKPDSGTPLPINLTSFLQVLSRGFRLLPKTLMVFPTLDTPLYPHIYFLSTPPSQDLAPPYHSASTMGLLSALLDLCEPLS